MSSGDSEANIGKTTLGNLGKPRLEVKPREDPPISSLRPTSAGWSMLFPLAAWSHCGHPLRTSGQTPIRHFTKTEVNVPKRPYSRSLGNIFCGRPFLPLGLTDQKWKAIHPKARPALHPEAPPKEPTPAAETVPSGRDFWECLWPSYGPNKLDLCMALSSIQSSHH